MGGQEQEQEEEEEEGGVGATAAAQHSAPRPHARVGEGRVCEGTAKVSHKYERAASSARHAQRGGGLMTNTRGLAGCAFRIEIMSRKSAV